MRRFPAISVVVLLVVILILTILLPPAVSKIKDQMLLGKVKTQQLERRAAADEGSLSAVDKIALICKYGRRSKNIVMVKQDQKMGSAVQDAPPVVALNEVRKLINVGIFPDIELSDDFKCSYQMEIYSDVDKPSQNARIWNINFALGKYVIYLMMDADTHLIYEYIVWSNGGYLPLMDSERTSQKYAQYIGVKWDSKSYTQDGTEQYSAANGTIFYQYSPLAELNGIKVMGMHLVTDDWVNGFLKL